MNAFKKLTLVAALLGSVLVGCGGGDTVASTSLGGTVAVGFAIVGGTVNVKCASTGTIAATTTSATGALQVDLAGKTLPCAIEVTGGTINSVANTTAYHSIAMAIGNVNVTPLTDLLIANLAASTTPSAWYAALTPAALAAITSTQVSTATTNVKTALGLTTQLAGLDPITTAFSPTRNNVMDNTLEAIQSAITNNGSSHATLLGLAGASAGAAFTPPAGFNTALSTAYSTSSTGSSGSSSGGGSSTTPAITSFSPTSGASSAVVTITGTNLTNVSQVLFTGPSPSTAFVAGVISARTATSITTAVPASLAAGSYTVSVTYTGGEAAASGTLTVTAAPVTSTATGLTISPALSSRTSFTAVTPVAFPQPPHHQVQYRNPNLNTASDSLDTFDVSYLVVSGNTFLNMSLMVGTSTIFSDGNSSTSFTTRNLNCSLGVAVGTNPECSAAGVVFNKTGGTITFTNASFANGVSTHAITGSLAFTPF